MTQVRNNSQEESSSVPTRDFRFNNNYDAVDSRGNSVVNNQHGNVVRKAASSGRPGDILIVRNKKTTADLPVSYFSSSGTLRPPMSTRNITADSLVTDLEAAQSMEQERGYGADDVLPEDSETVESDMQDPQEIGSRSRYSSGRTYRSTGRSGTKPFGKSATGSRSSRSFGTSNTGRAPHYNRGTAMNFSQKGRSNHDLYGKHSYQSF